MLIDWPKLHAKPVPITKLLVPVPIVNDEELVDEYISPDNPVAPVAPAPEKPDIPVAPLIPE